MWSRLIELGYLMIYLDIVKHYLLQFTLWYIGIIRILYIRVQLQVIPYHKKPYVHIQFIIK